jgi:hypothetical protein
VSKLVRARVKPIEQLPEWAKCCKKCISYLLALGVFEVDLSKTDSCKEGERFCIWCDAERPASKAAMNLSTGRFIQLSLLDLDEGPVSA